MMHKLNISSVIYHQRIIGIWLRENARCLKNRSVPESYLSAKLMWCSSVVRKCCPKKDKWKFQIWGEHTHTRPWVDDERRKMPISNHNRTHNTGYTLSHKYMYLCDHHTNASKITDIDQFSNCNNAHRCSFSEPVPGKCTKHSTITGSWKVLQRMTGSIQVNGNCFIKTTYYTNIHHYQGISFSMHTTCK